MSDAIKVGDKLVVTVREIDEDCDYLISGAISHDGEVYVSQGSAIRAPEPEPFRAERDAVIEAARAWDFGERVGVSALRSAMSRLKEVESLATDPVGVLVNEIRVSGVRHLHPNIERALLAVERARKS